MCKRFSVKDFSGSALPMILKFGINVGCDMLYCLHLHSANHSLYLFFFSFSPIKRSVIDFSAPMRIEVLKFRYVLSKNDGYFLFYFILFFFFFCIM